MGVSSWIANMKLFAVLSLIAVASAAQLSNVHWEPLETFFTLVEERSSNGSPTVKVTFSDGYTDTLVLSRYHSSEEDRIAGVEECHFIGHLEKEVDACVAMTGCVGSEDVDLTILSTCSVKDMQAHYLTQKNNWCMELAPTACDGSGTVPVTVAPATTTTTPAPPSATCDINNFFGLSGINNNITLTISMNGKAYHSKLSCKNSICTPLEAGVTNACEYICGNTTCP